MADNYIDLPLSGGGGGGVSGITSINGDSTASQTLSVGTTGSDFSIVDNSVGGHIFELPNAGASARGVVSTGAQTFAGIKTLSSAPVISALTASTVPYLDSGKALASSAVTPTELGYVSGVTSAIQTQLSGKVGTTGNETVAGIKTFSSAPVMSALTASKLVLTDSGKALISSSYGESDLLLTSTDQSAAGVKTFTDRIVVKSAPPVGGLTNQPGYIGASMSNLLEGQAAILLAGTINTTPGITDLYGIVINPEIDGTLNTVVAYGVLSFVEGNYSGNGTISAVTGGCRTSSTGDVINGATAWNAGGDFFARGTTVGINIGCYGSASGAGAASTGASISGFFGNTDGGDGKANAKYVGVVASAENPASGGSHIGCYATLGGISAGSQVPAIKAALVADNQTLTDPIFICRSGGSVIFEVEDLGNIRTNQTAAATTPGSVVAKMPIYNAAGTLVGYMPIYNSIS